MLKRRLKIVLMVLTALLVLCLAFLLFERFRGQMSLARYERELAAKGEKLTPQELGVSVLDADNGAPVVQEAITRLKEGFVLPKHPPPRMKLTKSGRAIVGFREPEWIEDKTTNRWEQVDADLAANAAVLGQIREALGKQAFDNKLDYSQGFDLLLPHLANGRPLAQWFGAETQLALRHHRNADAAACLVAGARLAKLLVEDRLLISELVRVAISAMAVASLWEALQTDVLEEKDLVAIQAAWQSQDFAQAMASSLEGERIYGQVSYDLFRKSNAKTAQMLFWMEEWVTPEDSERPAWERAVRRIPFGGELADVLKKQVYCRLWRFAWSHQDQRRSMREMQELVEVMRLAAKNRSFAEARIEIQGMESASIRMNFYDRLRFPNPSSFFTTTRAVSKAMQAETQRSIALSAIALKRHQLRFGNLPASLDSLVPEFLASVPIDYMDGQPMKYRLNDDGGFTLYSVGEDGKDDGGDATLLPEKSNTRNLWDRNDFIWPAPALPEEVEAHRKEFIEE